MRGYKARITTLENEVNQFKQQMQILINKSNTDDQFIDALKDEMYRCVVIFCVLLLSMMCG